MLTTFFYIFYVLFAIVLINLFIGIVTDAFPKARRHSQEAWEKLITRMLEVSTSACTLVGHGIDRDGVLDHTRNTRNFNKLCRGWGGASGGRCHFAGAETDSAWWKRLSKPGAMFVTVAAVALVRGFAKAHSTFAEGTRGHFHVSCCCRGDADNAAQQREQCIGTAKVQPR